MVASIAFCQLFSGWRKNILIGHRLSRDRRVVAGIFLNVAWDIKKSMGG